MENKDYAHYYSHRDNHETTEDLRILKQAGDD